MKITWLFLFIFIASAWAENTKAQSQPFSISVQTGTWEQVFDAIEKQSNYRFVYDNNVVNIKNKASVQADKKELTEILNQLFKNSNVQYTVMGEKIVLSKATAPASFLLKGTVFDENGEGVIGANIMIVGTAKGTITDAKGNFQLQVAPNEQIRVSYIGYISQIITVKNNKALTVRLVPEDNALNEVVVVGYGTQKKVNLSGAVESITGKQLENRSTSNVAMALQGLIPSLTVQSSNGGQTGSTAGFNIRGETSINGGSPLILVDGIPTSDNDFSRMNSMDIESISVLKDASSAAIYGARAAFGVILVTTKKGKGEKLTIQFNNNFNVRQLTRVLDVVTDPYIQASYQDVMGAPWYDMYSVEQLEYAKQLSQNPSLPTMILNTQKPGFYKYMAATDWYRELFNKTGYSHQHSLSVSGETEKVSYYMGLEYYRENGLVKYNTDSYDRFNMRSKVDYKVTRWLTIGNNTSLTYFVNKRPNSLGPDLFQNMNEIGDYMPIYNPDGSFTREGAKRVGALKYGGEASTKALIAQTQFNLNLSLIQNIWSVKADYTASTDNGQTKSWYSDESIPYKMGPELPELSLNWGSNAASTSSSRLYQVFNLYTDFQKTFGRDHALSAVLGYNQECETVEGFTAGRADLITETYPTLQLATGEMTMDASATDWALRSAFYRVNYIYKGRYILETNGRYDGSSRFPKKDRFGFFPSFSAAWVVSEENFFAPIKSWFSHAKVRASYGSLGNQHGGAYQYLSTMSAGKIGSILNGSLPVGVSTPGLVSNSLTWETVNTSNVGLDMNFFKNRLMLSGDMYVRKTLDMLAKGKTLPGVLGTTEPRINAADLKTEGWEVSIGWRDNVMVMGKPLQYSVRGILSDSRSFITKFDNPTKYLKDYYEGQEIGEIWGLVTEGFFTSKEDIRNHADQWEVTAYPGDRSLEPGDLKYKDLNGDEVITKGSETVNDPGDFKIIGNTRDRYNYGIDLNADWNGFDLRMLFQGVGKKDYYPTGPGAKNFFGIFTSPWQMVLKNNLDHWTPENPNAYFPRLKSYIANGVADMSLPQTRYLQNAAYVRMKNLTVGYTLPQQITRKIQLQRVRVYFSGENLFEITKLSRNFDPEVLGGYYHPLQRTYSIGLSLTL